MAARILVVVEDEVLGDRLRARLRTEEYTVVTGTDGVEALCAVGVELPDAIVLDLAVPGLDGPSIRRHHADHGTSRVPILVLTGETERLDQILTADLDADDFMTKPYDEGELVVRLRALLQRTGPSSPTRMIRAGIIEMDTDRHVVKVSGKEVRFTLREFELLRALIEAKGRTLRRDFLLVKVCGYVRTAGVKSRTIDVHIGRLREKLGTGRAGILTVRNVGYRFDMSVAILRKASLRADPE